MSINGEKHRVCTKVHRQRGRTDQTLHWQQLRSGVGIPPAKRREGCWWWGGCSGRRMRQVVEEDQGAGAVIREGISHKT